jgi:hypothetical protein
VSIQFQSPSYRAASSDLTIQISPLGLVELVVLADLPTLSCMARGKKSEGFRTSEPLYAVWSVMHARCENPKHNRYHVYGGRGISVCSQWADYLEFRRWASKSGYRRGLQIDRRNTGGNYSPENCHWTSPKHQQRNRRNNRLVTYAGVTKTLADWADDPRCVVPYKMLWERLQDGWDFDRALTQPQRRDGGYRLIIAWGEEKSITEWLADPRCPGLKHQTLWQRINIGWPPERAISMATRGRG